MSGVTPNIESFTTRMVGTGNISASNVLAGVDFAAQRADNVMAPTHGADYTPTQP